ncbi:MAG: GNAT family N-acetyltransferase [Candidatus Dormibacter sp.]
MSVHLDALADEVFSAADAQARGEGDAVRLFFGEVRRNPAYPDLFFLHGIADLRAPDWTVTDLERIIAEHLPGLTRVRVSSRDPATIAGLGPRLAEAGSDAERRVAMVQVAPPDGPGVGGPEVGLIESAADWRAFEQLVGEDAREHGWTPAMTGQLVALYRWQAANQPQSWLLARASGDPVGRVGLYQHGTVGYLHALYTRASARRRGVGSSLVWAVGERARALGCERVTLQCTRDSFLPGFYRALGFRTVGEMWIWMKSAKR